MALIRLHKVMIGTALAFCALFAVRGFMIGETLMGGAFFGITVGLGVYFRWFLAEKAGSFEE